MNIISPKLDMLILQIDVDVVYEDDITSVDFPKKISPPEKRFIQDVDDSGYDRIRVDQKISFLEDCIFYWVDGKFEVNEYIQCLPSDNMEAWILYAFNKEVYHNPPERHIERLCKPDNIIAQKSIFNEIKVPRKNGKLKKSERFYRIHLIPKLLEHWFSVVEVCDQARKFDSKLKKAIEEGFE